VADLPARETRIINHFTALCNELAEVRLAETRARGLANPRPFFDFLFTLPVRIHDRLAREGWKKIMGLGFAGHTWEIWPMMRPGAYPMSGSIIDPEIFVKWQRNIQGRQAITESSPGAGSLPKKEGAGS